MEQWIEKALEKSAKEPFGLSEILLSDFMLHLSVTTLMLLLKYLIAEAKTPEEKETLKTVPDQIIDTWEKSRSKGILGGMDQYLKMFTENSGGRLTQNEIEELAKKFAEDEKQNLARVVESLRGAIVQIKSTL
jgi:hypothetical protein